MYDVVLNKQFIKFLKKRDRKFREKFEDMRMDFTRWKLEKYDIEPIVWEVDTFRVRIGKYRMLYVIDSEGRIIFFFNWWPRWDVYKK